MSSQGRAVAFNAPPPSPVVFLQVCNPGGEVETLKKQLHAQAVCQVEQNGVVTVDDLELVQRTNRELEQQLGEKNKVCRGHLSGASC